MKQGKRTFLCTLAGAAVAAAFADWAWPTADALREAVGQAKRLVTAVRADLGAVFDRAAERLPGWKALERLLGHAAGLPGRARYSVASIAARKSGVTSGSTPSTP